MYGDLRVLLTRGFLSLRINLRGVSLVVRSLTSEDYQLLNEIVDIEGPDWPLWASARSMWLVDGLDTLEGGSGAFHMARRLLGSLPGEIPRTLWDLQVRLFERAQKAGGYLHPFFFEEESRQLWGSTARGMRPIPGQTPLQANSLQTAWVAYNVVEDERLEAERQWASIRPLIGLQSRQAMKGVVDADKARLEAEASRREQILQDAYKLFRGGAKDSACP